MNWVTLVLLVFIGFLTYRAYRNGFIRELVSLCAVILAVPLAGIFYDDMYPKVQPIIENERLANLVAFMAILLAVVLAGQIISYILRNAVTMLNLGAIDHVAGGAFGFLKAVIIAQVVLIVLVVFPNPNVKGPIDKSPVATRLLDSAPVVLAFLPGQFERALNAFLDNARQVDAELGPDDAATPRSEPR